jgi:hypothetical protein
LVALIDTKRSRSSSGTRGLRASSRTRQLKDSQLISRLKKRAPFWGTPSGKSCGSGNGVRRKSACVMVLAFKADESGLGVG